jgi:hypothetical protein
MITVWQSLSVIVDSLCCFVSKITNVNKKCKQYTAAEGNYESVGIAVLIIGIRSDLIA